MSVFGLRGQFARCCLWLCSQTSLCHLRATEAKTTSKTKWEAFYGSWPVWWWASDGRLLLQDFDLGDFHRPWHGGQGHRLTASHHHPWQVWRHSFWGLWKGLVETVRHPHPCVVRSWSIVSWQLSGQSNGPWMFGWALPSWGTLDHWDGGAKERPLKDDPWKTHRPVRSSNNQWM